MTDTAEFAAIAGNTRRYYLTVYSAEIGGTMIVDTALLCCGAEFSRSAGSLCRDGATKFAAVATGSTIFGNFDAATTFRTALITNRDHQVAAMHSHRSALESLAEKSQLAAAAFAAGDDSSSKSISSASL